MNPLKNLFLSIVLFFAGNLFSQEIWFGPKTGLNIIPIEKTELRGNSFAPGFHIGGTLEYRFNNWFSLSADLLYTTKKKIYESTGKESFFNKISGFMSFLPDSAGGFSIDSLIGTAVEYMNDTVYSRTSGFVKLGYIELPLMAKFRYKGFSFSTGPYVAILLSNKATEELTQDIPLLKTFGPVLDTVPFLPQLVKGIFPAYYKPEITKDIVSNEIKMFDFGFVTDISYQAGSNIIFSLRYTRGFPNYRSPEYRKKDYLSTINISIGYFFNANKIGGNSFL